MNINKTFKSNYLKAADLDDEDRIVTINTLSIEEVGQDKEEKPVLYFEEYEAGMVLNKTNANTIAAMYGTETDEWAGKKIVLFSAMVDFGGKSVEAIRIKGRPPKTSTTPVRKPQPAQSGVGRPGAGYQRQHSPATPPQERDTGDVDPETGDEIPF